MENLEQQKHKHKYKHKYKEKKKYKTYPDAISFTKVFGLAIDFSLVGLASLIGFPYLLYEKLMKIDHIQNISTTQANKPLVVLVHGSGVGNWQWAMAKVYLAMYKIPYYCTSYDYTQSVDQCVEEVYRDLTLKLKDQEGQQGQGEQREIVLIGHSLGGLVSRLLHNKEDSTLRIVKTFILHTPQNGVYIANVRNKLFRNRGYTITQSMTNMEVDSDFVKEYKERCQNENDSEIYEVAGRCDYVDPKFVFWKCEKENKYLGWFGHYYPAVNPFLWLGFILNKL